MFSPFRPKFALFLGVALLAAAQAGTAVAQFPGRRPGPGFEGAMPGAAMVMPSGTIEAVGPRVLQIKSITGQPFFLYLADNVQIHVTGTAKADVIAPGTFISFFADVDKRRSEVQDKVDALTIFTFSPERPLGAFPSGAGGAAGAGAEPFAANPPAAQPPARSRRQPAAAADNGPPVESFEIVGRVTGIDKDGTLTVFVPNNPYFKPPVEIELTEEPEITVDLSGPAMLRFVQPGDKVQARGRQVAENAVQVTDLNVQLTEPLTTVHDEDSKKKPTRRTTRDSRRKRGEPDEPAETEEAAEPAKKTEAKQEPEDEKQDEEAP